MNFQIPIGPQHPALKEPISLRMTVDGEVITDADIRLGYNHRGLEKLAEDKNWIQNIYLTERICGICSHSHATCYVQAVEKLMEIMPPRRGLYIRYLVSELERVHSHLLWLGVAGHEAGFDSFFMYTWRDREIVMDLLEMISGNRVHYAMNTIGGVRRDIDEGQKAKILEGIATLKKRSEYYFGIGANEPSFVARIAGVGLLSKQQAIDLCAVGPVARASGVARDVRKEDPYAVYDELDFELCTSDSCDVLGRVVVRVMELLQSYRMIEQMVKGLPDGDIVVKAPRKAKPGEAVSRYEAPRGENIHYVKVQRMGQARAPQGPGPHAGQLPGDGGHAAQGLHRRHPPDLRRHRPVHLLRRAGRDPDQRPQRRGIGRYDERPAPAGARPVQECPRERESGMALLRTLLYLLVYPGILFLFAYATFCEWFDRKVYARLQNRMGPTHTGRFGLLQPIADFFKLLAKEDVVPDAADKGLFNVLPAVGLAVVSTAALLLPVWNFNLAKPGLTSFSGDIIVMLYLLSLPTLILFLAAWSSTNLFSTIGGARVLTMLFGYEVPLFLAVLSPAILANSWRLAEIAAFYQARPLLLLVNLVGFLVALIAVQAKLERTPFDIPDAETEIVGGTFTEYSGKKLALFRLTFDIELVVASGLLAAVFLGGFPGGALLGFVHFVVKTLFVIFLLSLIRALTSRIRIDQVVSFAWKILAPLAVLQLLATILLKGFLS